MLGALQRHADPSEVRVLLSHLHADHCLDLPGLFVWRRYHPIAGGGRAMCTGRADTSLGSARRPSEGGEIDDFSDIFDIRPWDGAAPVRIGRHRRRDAGCSIPTESYGMRFSDLGHASSTAATPATRTSSSIWPAAPMCSLRGVVDPRPRDRPPHLHLSGTEAGQLAARAGVRELLLTHIPPWTSREDVISEAKAEFDGPVHAVCRGSLRGVGQSRTGTDVRSANGARDPRRHHRANAPR